MIFIYGIGRPYKFQSCSSLIILSFFCNLITVVLLDYAQNVPNYNSAIIITYFVVQLFFFFVGFVYILMSIEYRPHIVTLIVTLKKKEKLKKFTNYLERKINYTEVEMKNEKLLSIANTKLNIELKIAVAPQLETQEALIIPEQELNKEDLVEIKEAIEEKGQENSSEMSQMEIPSEK